MSESKDMVWKCALILLGLWAVSRGKSEAQGILPNDLTVRSLFITDSYGRKRISLSVQKNRPKIVLHDERGHYRVALTQTGDASTVEIRGGPRRPSLRLIAGKDAVLEILDSHEIVRARLAIDKDGRPTLDGFGANGERLGSEQAQSKDRAHPK